MYFTSVKLAYEMMRHAAIVNNGSFYITSELSPDVHILAAHNVIDANHGFSRIEVYVCREIIAISDTEHAYYPPPGLDCTLVLRGLKQILEAAVTVIEAGANRIIGEGKSRIDLLKRVTDRVNSYQPSAGNCRGSFLLRS